MEYDSASSCEGRLRDFEVSVDLPHLRETQVDCPAHNSNSAQWHSLQVLASQPKLKMGANRSLSSQVMEYYQTYSQSTNLDQYFSLPATSSPPEAIKYYYSIYELNPKLGANRQDCIGEEYNLRSYVPRERRRWVRPPLIGQSSNTEASSRYVRPLTDPQSPSPDLKRVTPETIPEEKQECHDITPETAGRKLSSPTSSIASHKPLEWDSGADVGYYNILPHNKQRDKKLSTIERMALARGCSAALRLDPEGTTESGISGKATGSQRNSKLPVVPDANSTPLLGNASGSESEIEITPIVKNHLPGIITGNDIRSDERNKVVKQQESCPVTEQNHETPRSSFAFKMPYAKYPTEGKKIINRNKQENVCSLNSPLKKSTSMNTLVIPPSKLALKRSQSELNLQVKDKNKSVLPLIFNSTSSIATVVSRPATCDKVIQTSLNVYRHESVGVQVSVLEEKPPLPKRGTSLQKSVNSILKHPKGTYKVENSKKQATRNERERKERKTSSSEDGSGTPQPDDMENVTGRANSFEYFPGHIYENVPNGSGSHISSSETGRSNSTLPNTSSSINEKLWGDSDSLVRDLERSVNILKSLVDANKCDKEVKKRLIHHVVKRLITAKYTDDKIEHNLEDNVPWNPDDARNKVYRTEILQALTKKHSTTDSSDDWNMQKKGSRRKGHIVKEVLESSNSDKFDKNTDRTETDGRKARMGLRVDDCHRNTNTTDRSESSECFLPQRTRKTKVQDIFSMKEKCKLQRQDSTTTTTPPDHNRMLLDAVVNRRAIRSSNTEVNDWRLLTTLSERQFELKKCNSDSGDSKLVSYAEMEKRNQLIWITNEISHLCNLKKLLEQPKKLERKSPRKLKPGNKSKQSSKDDEYIHCKNDSYVQENSAEEPWSSHCNLALGPTSSVIQRIKKRNSCAQTATNVTSAHSKTGGEIVSANLLSSTMKLVDTGVQTMPQEIPTLIQSEIVHYIKCPAHDMQFQNSLKCKEQTCRCLKHNIQNVVTCRHCSQAQNELAANENIPMQKDIARSVNSLIHRCTEAGKFKQKETKNQINASKSKCDCKNVRTCDCVNICKCGINAVENRRPLAEVCKLRSTRMASSNFPKCEQCQQTFYSREETEALKDCTCTDERESDKQEWIPKSNSKCRKENGHVSTLTENRTKVCGCSTDCACETIHGSDRDNTNSRNICDCRSIGRARYNEIRHCVRCTNQGDRQTRSYQANKKVNKVQNGTSCNCGTDCLCNKGKGVDEKLYNKAHKISSYDESSVTDSDRTCKSCRHCGTAYQNARKCNCCQSYPKAVAYELSFAKENNWRNDNSAASKVPLLNHSANGKSDCACNTVKKIGRKYPQQKSTLQDYLSKNKPEFVGNAETRRQYMSEISHLRQLRKEKRTQLLAMASMSNIGKLPKTSSKPTVVCAQKKVTEDEMKDRLRRRYFRLNEVRFKKRQQEQQEDVRRNKLMAKIFGRKLQQKVLRGQVDLSQSVSVISNM